MEPPGQNEFQFLLVCSFFQPAHLALKPKPLCCLTTLPPRKTQRKVYPLATFKTKPKCVTGQYLTSEKRPNLL